jgi:hypothetical protein
VLVWGDSHALAWLPAFDDLLAKESLGGLFASRSACPPLVGVRNPESPGCFDYNARVWELIHDDPSLRLVVLIAAWPSYSWERGKYTISDAAGRSGNTTVFPDAMRETLTGIDRTGKVAWLIGPTPGAPSDLPLLLALTRLHGGSDLERVTRASFDERRRSFEQISSGIPKSAGILVTDPTPWFCDEIDCRFEREGLPLYRDGGHLNLRGAGFVGARVEPILREATARSRLGASPTPALQNARNAMGPSDGRSRDNP